MENTQDMSNGSLNDVIINSTGGATKPLKEINNKKALKVGIDSFVAFNVQLRSFVI